MTTPRKILKNHGIRPRKRLGQSFLKDRNITDRIVQTADIRKEDTVVEIGAGLGIMTELLAAQARRVIALEIDPYLVSLLREELKGHPNVEIIPTDVLKYDFSLACQECLSGKLKVIGNIPYNISSQILFHLISYKRCIACMILMFQKEMADRIVAPVGTKDYGVPSVALSMYGIVSHEMTVPPECFYPQPKVMSSVLKIVMRQKPLVDLKDDDFFRKIVKIAFSKRRKTLLNNLRSANLPFCEREINLSLEAAGIDGRRRGETLTTEEFGVLSNVLFNKITGNHLSFSVMPQPGEDISSNQGNNCNN
ncbi:MAG: 16S rRNA (adenine(1518)-N(6)/adenine(1519)-N(6))-dimethyltransferase RsmA [Syntrophales bacterium]|nr:16S rRNA (adenine(1518)-N(6)/adenine(1519)-N(6))-dimethyltransferase RsmA [Syntrophales bacterium]